MEDPCPDDVMMRDACAKEPSHTVITWCGVRMTASACCSCCCVAPCQGVFGQREEQRVLAGQVNARMLFSSANRRLRPARRSLEALLEAQRHSNKQLELDEASKTRQANDAAERSRRFQSGEDERLIDPAMQS